MTVRTTIVLYTDTREKLKKFGLKGDSYDDIISKLMESYESKIKK